MGIGGNIKQRRGKTPQIAVDVDKLSERQKEIYLLSKKGIMQTEIAKIYGCTKQNISYTLKKIYIDAENEFKRCNENRGQFERYNYKDADLNVLTRREKEVIEKMIKGETRIQIAQDMGITPKTVGIYLCRARAKLENRETYEQKNRDKINAKRRTPEHREKEKVWHKNFVNAHPEFKKKISEYNKEYYAKNKGKILKKSKQRREKKVEFAE